MPRDPPECPCSDCCPGNPVLDKWKTIYGWNNTQSEHTNAYTLKPTAVLCSALHDVDHDFRNGLNISWCWICLCRWKIGCIPWTGTRKENRKGCCWLYWELSFSWGGACQKYIYILGKITSIFNATKAHNHEQKKLEFEFAANIGEQYQCNDTQHGQGGGVRTFTNNPL